MWRLTFSNPSTSRVPWIDILTLLHRYLSGSSCSLRVIDSPILLSLFHLLRMDSGVLWRWQKKSSRNMTALMWELPTESARSRVLNKRMLALMNQKKGFCFWLWISFSCFLPFFILSFSYSPLFSFFAIWREGTTNNDGGCRFLFHCMPATRDEQCEIYDRNHWEGFRLEKNLLSKAQETVWD